MKIESSSVPQTISPPAPYTATIVVIGLAGVVPVLLWNLPGGVPEFTWTEVLLTAVMVVSGVRFAWVIGTRDRHLHEMTLWLFAYLFLGVAPFVQTRTSFPGTVANLELSLLPTAAALTLVGCLAAIAGSSVAGRRSGRSSIRPAELIPQVSATATYIWSLVVLGLAAVYAARIGPQNLFLSRSEVKVSWAANLGYDPVGILIGSGSRMGLIVAFVALMLLRRQRRGTDKSAPLFLPILVFVTLFALINPFSSARYTLGTAVLAVLGAFGAYSTIRRFRAVAVGALVGLVAIFPIMSTFRRTLDATVELESPLESMTTGDFDAFAQIVNTLEYTGTVGLAWGNQLLGVLFFWLPRSVWPTKPIDTGVLLGDFKEYRFTNLSASLWTEFYINFGWIGLVVGMFLLGVLLRVLDRRAEEALRISPIPGLAACITPFYMLIVLRGSLLQATSELFIIAVGGWLLTRSWGGHRAARTGPTRQRRAVPGSDLATSQRA